MLFNQEALHQHVVYVHFDISLSLVFEHLIDEPLVGCPRILQTERHHSVVVKPPISDESCYFLVKLVHLYLIVSRECIHEAEGLVTGR